MLHHSRGAMRPSACAIALTCALACSISPAARGAENDAVVVTATRSADRASAVISDVSVISREQIERSPQSSLGELLQAQPGLQLTTNGGMGTPSAISIRGGAASQTLVLIDGQRMSSATQGTTALEHIPLNQIERVEILRGPASSLYGADAVAGVVQVFTRTRDGAPRFSAEGGIGSYRTGIGSLNYGGRIADTRFNVNLGYVRSGSFSATTPGAFGFNADRDPYTNTNLSANVAQRFGANHELGARIFQADGKTHFDAANCDPSFTVCTNDFDNVQKQTLQSASVYSRNRLSGIWTSEFTAGRSEDKLTSFMLDPAAGSVNGQGFRTVQNQLAWQNDFATRAGRLMLAAEHRREAVDSNAVAYTVAERTTNALLAGYRTGLGSHSIQASARRDDNSQFGIRSSGTIGYSYSFTRMLRASASLGTSFRAPTFNDLYWPVDFASFYVGNPNLKPERGHNREAGLVYENAVHRISVTAYRNKVSDLIAFGNAPAPAFFFTTVNVGAALLRGVTTSYDGRFGDWLVRASYDALSAKDLDTGKTLIRRARETGTGELRRESGRWNSGAQIVASGPRWVDTANTRQTRGFALFNLDTRYRLTREWAVVGRVNNLFDKKYELVQGFATPGANLFVGLRYAAL